MNNERLTLTNWDILTPAEREDAARAVTERLPAPFTFRGMETHSQGEQQHEVAVFDHDGTSFALIPGGQMTLGFDWNRALGQTLRGRIKSSMMPALMGLRLGRENRLTPLREATIQPLLMQVRAEEFGVETVTQDDPEVRQMFERIGLSPDRTITAFSDGESRRTFRFTMFADSAVRIEEKKDTTHQDIQTEVGKKGFRLPTSDEWEHACAAGARTLFRWGSDCPLKCYPNDDRFEEWLRIAPLYNKRNAFGLWIATDPYNWEACEDPTIMRGGDGGVAICGAEGIVAGWLPLASSFTCQVEAGYDFSTVYVRRVYPLS